MQNSLTEAAATQLLAALSLIAKAIAAVPGLSTAAVAAANAAFLV